MMPPRFPSSARAAVSRRRKPASPSRSKIAGMGIPAVSSTAASLSSTGRRSFSARAMATVVFPLPGMPMRITFSVSRRRAAVMHGMTSSGMALPVKSSEARLAWAASIQRPPAQGMPSRSACRSRAVRAGL